MSWLQQALLESTIVQALVTLVLVGVICYLAVTGQAIPDLLVNITTLIIGFWFGTKGVQAARVGKV
jgi:hypothetical protein